MSPTAAPTETRHVVPEISFEVERKKMIVGLIENDRGQFVRITEDVRGRRDTIRMPATGLVQLRDALDKMIAATARH